MFWPWDTAVKPLPTGWTRDVAFDDRFLQGDNAAYTGPANAGGPHSHTDNGHAHVGHPHSHMFSGVSVTGAGTDANCPVKPPPTHLAALCTHDHAPERSAFTVIEYAQGEITVGHADAKPPCVRAIVIQPEDSRNDVPNHAVCFCESDVPPIGYNRTDGSGGTPDLNGKFIVGAETEGTGGTTDGHATHTHDSPAHTHDVLDHSHVRAQCGPAMQTDGITTVGTARLVRRPSHHGVTLNAKALADLSSDAATIQPGSSEPAYIKLLGIQNTSGRATTPAGLVVAFVGASTEIPDNWVLCDGGNGTRDCTDRQVKITTADDEIGDIGGANSHAHKADAHAHTHTAGHSHTATQTWQGMGGDAGAFAVCGGFLDRHRHVWTVADAVPTMQTATVMLTSADKRYRYRTVLWIKRTFVTRKRITVGSIHKTDEVVIAA